MKPQSGLLLSNTRKSLLLKFTPYLQSLIVLAVLFLLGAVITPRFLSPVNLNNLVKQQVSILLIAAGVTFVILTGELDMSVGSILVLSASITARLLEISGLAIAIPAGLVSGILIGMLNGILITRGRIPSFIATLGTLMIAKSLAFVITNGQVLFNIPDSLQYMGQHDILGIPMVVMMVIAVYLLCHLALDKTPFGKKIYAVGADSNSVRYSGIDTSSVKMRVFIISGFLSAVGGLFFLSRIGAIQAHAGAGLELDSIAAVVIGGTSLSGGSGGVIQTVIGVFIIGMTRNVLNLLHINTFWQDFFTGSIIIIASLFDISRQRKRSRI